MLDTKQRLLAGTILSAVVVGPIQAALPEAGFLIAQRRRTSMRKRRSHHSGRDNRNLRRNSIKCSHRSLHHSSNRRSRHNLLPSNHSRGHRRADRRSRHNLLRSNHSRGHRLLRRVNRRSHRSLRRSSNRHSRRIRARDHQGFRRLRRARNNKVSAGPVVRLCSRRLPLLRNNRLGNPPLLPRRCARPLLRLDHRQRRCNAPSCRLQHRIMRSISMTCAAPAMRYARATACLSKSQGG